ncbi:Transcriptional regulator [Burkholderia dolosa AU0158]|nr:Transcriptional regulator [Burkholderia dolosa AU0158]
MCERHASRVSPVSRTGSRFVRLRVPDWNPLHAQRRDRSTGMHGLTTGIAAIRLRTGRSSRQPPAWSGTPHAQEDMRDMLTGSRCGRLRILSTPGFGRKIVAPLLSDFHARHPRIVLELVLSGDVVDFDDDGIDVWIIDGRVKRAAIVARKLMPLQLVVCASHAYAHLHGLPQRIDDLADHRCINFREASGRVRDWRFKVDDRMQRHRPVARHTFNDADLIVQAVLDGLGIAQLPVYQVCALLAEGRLIRCLARYAPDDGAHYLCYRRERPLPAHVRAFVDYVTVRMHALHA